MTMKTRTKKTTTKKKENWTRMSSRDLQRCHLCDHDSGDFADDDARHGGRGGADFGCCCNCSVGPQQQRLLLRENRKTKATRASVDKRR